MSLVRAERRRFVKRQMIVWTLILYVGLLTTIGTIVFFTTTKPTAEARAAAQVEAQADFRAAMAEHERCKDKADSPECRRTPWAQEAPQEQYFQPENYMDPSFNFSSDAEDFVFVWAVLLSMVAFIIGASFVGAEWRSGAMMNLLTWRPKRLQVLGTKLAVLLGWMTVLGAAIFGLWTAALAGIAQAHGTMEGMTSSAWQIYGLTGLRGLGMILFFCALGFGLASIGRHIALALGAALGFIVVGQFGFTAVAFMAEIPYPEQYLLTTHMEAWMSKSVEVENPFSQLDPVKVISYGETGSLALAIAAVVLGLAFYLMKRRDIAG
jgi:ABC-type transport system involved in multi-copper enzyme maturation permease subunit